MTEQTLDENCRALCLAHPKHSTSTIVLTIQTGLWITVLTHSIGKPAYATTEPEAETKPTSQQPTVPALFPAPTPNVKPSPSPTPETPVSFTPSTPSPRATPPPVSASASPPEVGPSPGPGAPPASIKSSLPQKSAVPQITSRPEPAAATQAAFSESTLPVEGSEIAAPVRAQVEAPPSKPNLPPLNPHLPPMTSHLYMRPTVPKLRIYCP